MPVYTRILYPGSKRSPLEDTRKFFGRPECTLEQVYRALSLPATEFSEIQADMYKRSQKLWKRNTQVVYYNPTNYFFEREEECGLVRFGHCKEGRPLPLVQPGLFMDHDGFPLAMCIEPGNKTSSVCRTYDVILYSSTTVRTLQPLPCSPSGEQGRGLKILHELHFYCESSKNYIYHSTMIVMASRKT